jgi:fused signal recognition particle receptor
MSWATRFKEGLKRATKTFTTPLKGAFSFTKIDAEVWENLEARLLEADFGFHATQNILEALKKQKPQDGSALETSLKDYLQKELEPFEDPLMPGVQKPWVCVFVGVNGSGKTSTVGKLAQQYRALGKRVLIVAGDTFRAAATEQLKVWAERSQADFLAAASEADSAALAYQGLEKAKREGYDVLLIDTAGRLHNQQNLMAELSKIVRVLRKQDPETPHEISLVLDGTVGQNVLSQVRLFQEAVPITGLIVTKLDGTSKAGFLLPLVTETRLPLKGVGVGEKLEDLGPFSAKAFSEALLSSAQD